MITLSRKLFQQLFAIWICFMCVGTNNTFASNKDNTFVHSKVPESDTCKLMGECVSCLRQVVKTSDSNQQKDLVQDISKKLDTHQEIVNINQIARELLNKDELQFRNFPVNIDQLARELLNKDESQFRNFAQICRAWYAMSHLHEVNSYTKGQSSRYYFNKERSFLLGILLSHKEEMTETEKDCFKFYVNALYPSTIEETKIKKHNAHFKVLKEAIRLLFVKNADCKAFEEQVRLWLVNMNNEEHVFKKEDLKNITEAEYHDQAVQLGDASVGDIELLDPIKSTRTKKTRFTPVETKLSDGIVAWFADAIIFRSEFPHTTSLLQEVLTQNWHPSVEAWNSLDSLEGSRCCSPTDHNYLKGQIFSNNLIMLSSAKMSLISRLHDTKTPSSDNDCLEGYIFLNKSLSREAANSVMLMSEVLADQSKLKNKLESQRLTPFSYAPFYQEDDYVLRSYGLKEHLDFVRRFFEGWHNFNLSSGSKNRIIPAYFTKELSDFFTSRIKLVDQNKKLPGLYVLAQVGARQHNRNLLRLNAYTNQNIKLNRFKATALNKWLSVLDASKRLTSKYYNNFAQARKIYSIIGFLYMFYSLYSYLNQFFIGVDLEISSLWSNILFPKHSSIVLVVQSLQKKIQSFSTSIHKTPSSELAFRQKLVFVVFVLGFICFFSLISKSYLLNHVY